MKFLFLFVPLFAFGCAASPNMPTPLSGMAAVNATAISARETADAAQILAQGAQSNLSAAQIQQTAIVQVTADGLKFASTAQALQLNDANGTATATRVFATEQTQRDWGTATATVQQGINQQNTAATAQANQDRFSTAQANSAHETATATRVYATEVVQLAIDKQNAKDEAARRAAARQIASAKTKTEIELAPFQKAAEMFLPTLGCLFGIIVLLIIIWGLFRAVEGYIKAKSLDLAAPALAQMQIRDASGKPLGYLQLQNGIATFQPYFANVIESEPDEPAEPPRAAIPLTDMQDRKMLEAPKSEAVTTETSSRGIVTIYYGDLLTFTRTILETGDWSQPTWADKVLPRGFVLSKDGKTEKGVRAYGGYSRLLQLFVDKHLIIHRGQGKSGDWNPHAPRDVESVMKILTDAMMPPSLPGQVTPSPTAPMPHLRTA